jgi:hypothetical protein
MYRDTDILSQKGAITLENELVVFSTRADPMGYIRETLPDWIVSRHQGYCSALFRFEAVWKGLCHQMNTTPKEIILVSFLPSIPVPPTGNEFCEFRILEKVCDTLTRNGYIVRQAADFAVCERCGKLFLSKKAHTSLQALFMSNSPRPSPLLPLEWTPTGCS